MGKRSFGFHAKVTSGPRQGETNYGVANGGDAYTAKDVERDVAHGMNLFRHEVDVTVNPIHESDDNGMRGATDIEDEE